MMGVAAGMVILMFAAMAVFALAVTAFWIWMLVDCATNNRLQGNDKVVWILIVVFAHWIGALVYFFVERPKRNEPPPVPRQPTPPPVPG